MLRPRRVISLSKPPADDEIVNYGTQSLVLEQTQGLGDVDDGGGSFFHRHRMDQQNSNSISSEDGGDSIGMLDDAATVYEKNDNDQIQQHPQTIKDDDSDSEELSHVEPHQGFLPPLPPLLPRQQQAPTLPVPAAPALPSSPPKSTAVGTSALFALPAERPHRVRRRPNQYSISNVEENTRKAILLSQQNQASSIQHSSSKSSTSSQSSQHHPRGKSSSSSSSSSSGGGGGSDFDHSNSKGMKRKEILKTSETNEGNSNESSSSSSSENSMRSSSSSFQHGHHSSPKKQKMEHGFDRTNYFVVPPVGGDKQYITINGAPRDVVIWQSNANKENDDDDDDGDEAQGRHKKHVVLEFVDTDGDSTFDGHVLKHYSLVDLFSTEILNSRTNEYIQVTYNFHLPAYTKQDVPDGFEVQDGDDTYRAANIYQNKRDPSRYVLHFDNTNDYEGLSGPKYTWNGTLLTDGDNDHVEHRCNPPPQQEQQQQQQQQRQHHKQSSS